MRSSPDIVPNSAGDTNRWYIVASTAGSETRLDDVGRFATASVSALNRNGADIANNESVAMTGTSVRKRFFFPKGRLWYLNELPDLADYSR